MIYQLPLQTAGLAAGLLLLVSHAAALAAPGPSRDFARALPRSRVFGTILLAVAAVWSFVLVRGLDLGEFSPLRGPMLVGIVAGAVLTWLFVEEFLSARALGMLLLLAAEPLLESAVLRSEPSRLLLTVLAYAWASAGLVFVGMPYVLRDLIGWFAADPLRWKLAAAGGAAYGLVLIACAAFLW
jgi:hypothetical protein